jgi:hypothetical protein
MRNIDEHDAVPGPDTEPSADYTPPLDGPHRDAADAGPPGFADEERAAAAADEERTPASETGARDADTAERSQYLD